MVQAELELQLKVWKDLAISKQMLMKAATDALKLDPECSTEELKEALDAAIKKSIEADVNVYEAQEQAKLAIAVMEKKMAESEKAQSVAEASVAGMQDAQQQSERQMEAERAAHITELKKIKTQVVEKDKALKAINKALADTPENVVKKLRTLKKQKTDEALARRQAESDASSLRKEKRDLEKRVTELQAAVNDGLKLVNQYRELHTLCGTLHEQLKPLVDDAQDLPVLTAPDEQLLESIQKAAESDEK